MTEGTQPRTARGTMLSAGIAMAALVALLVFAPLASAATDPVGSGSATVTINNGFKKGLAKKGVTTLRVSPAKLKGSKLTLKITGGTIEPTTGKGSVNFGGGLKFKAGKKSVIVKKLVLNNTKSVLGAKLTGNVGGKNMVFATVVGQKASRNGFDVNLTIKQLKLTGKAAGQLNKKLGLKGKNAAFKGNKVMGSVKSEVKLGTIHVQAAGTASLALSESAVKKLSQIGPGKNGEFGVKLAPIAPTTFLSVSPPTLGFPITGGTINSTATAGTVETGGGVSLVQDLKKVGAGVNTITLGNIFIDLGAKAATVEVSITNPENPAANKGPLGRSSIADINLAGATVTSDPTAHTVTVTNASATLQALTAEVLNEVFLNKKFEEAIGPQERFAAGDPLGNFSFTATTE